MTKSIRNAHSTACSIGVPWRWPRIVADMASGAPMNSARLGVWIGSTLMAAGFVLMLLGFGILVYQTALWLRDGSWTSFPFRPTWYWLGGGEPSFEWEGVQDMAGWILDCPLAAVAFAAGLGVLLFGDKAMNQADQKLRARAGRW